LKTYEKLVIFGSKKHLQKTVMIRRWLKTMEIRRFFLGFSSRFDFR